MTRRFRYGGRDWFALKGEVGTRIVPVGGSGLPAPTADQVEAARRYYRSLTNSKPGPRLVQLARDLYKP